jgi:nucleolar GTP-binding protein
MVRRLPSRRGRYGRRPAPQRGKGREDRGAALRPSRGQRPSAVILDVAFRRAYRATPHGAERTDRSRRRALLKIVRSTAVVGRHLRLATRRFAPPGLTELERRLTEQRFGPAQPARALARVRRAEERIRRLAQEEQRALRRLSASEDLARAVRGCYGRLASFVREVDADLEMLRAIERFLSERPEIRPEVATLVVAGFPNVGKSSLVARLSTAKPTVAAYPFTTLAISVGHADLGFDRMQVVDTPGMLGRRGRENAPESEARATVERAAHVVLFVLDPTERCGFALAEQEALLARWRAEFPDRPILEVETKADLGPRRSERLQVSATTGAGLEELRRRIVAALERARPAPAAPPVEEAPAPEEAPDDGFRA